MCAQKFLSIVIIIIIFPKNPGSSGTTDFVPSTVISISVRFNVMAVRHWLHVCFTHESLRNQWWVLFHSELWTPGSDSHLSADWLPGQVTEKKRNCSDVTVSSHCCVFKTRGKLWFVCRRRPFSIDVKLLLIINTFQCTRVSVTLHSCTILISRL